MLGAGAWLWAARTDRVGALVDARVGPDSAAGAVVYTPVDLTFSEGLTLACLLRRPRSPAAGDRVPAVFVAGGQRTGRRAVAAIGREYAGAAFACDWPWPDPDRFSALGFALALPQLRSAMVATPQVHAAAAGWLLSNAWVDSSRFAALGASLGVPTIAAWAAHDPRVGAVALLYGGADLALMLDAALTPRVRPRVVRHWVAAALAAALRPLEPERSVAALAARPLFVAVAEQDERIPAESVRRLVAAAGAGARVHRLPGPHLRADDAALMAALTDTTLAWLAGVWSSGVLR